MTRKVSPKNDVAVDVRADDPPHAMDRFNDGLRRVLAAPRRRAKLKKRKRIT